MIKELTIELNTIELHEVVIITARRDGDIIARQEFPLFSSSIFSGELKPYISADAIMMIAQYYLRGYTVKIL